MTVHSSIAFLFAMSLFVASPGPGVMGCVAVGMRRSPWNSAAFIAGMILGDIVFLMFAVFGLTAVAQNFGAVFQVIRVLGGIYLLYLGVKMWRSEPLAITNQKPARKRGSFFGGLFITLSNPKVIIFYCGFLPNFMDLRALTASDLFVVCLLVAVVISGVMGVYSYIAARTGDILSRRSGKVLNRSAGTALAATGTFMIVKS